MTRVRDVRIINFVIPAKAGIQCLLYERHWVPAFAGTTVGVCERNFTNAAAVPAFAGTTAL